MHEATWIPNEIFKTVWEIGSVFKCLKAFSLCLAAFDVVEWEIVFKSSWAMVFPAFWLATIKLKAVCKAGILKHFWLSEPFWLKIFTLSPPEILNQTFACLWIYDISHQFSYTHFVKMFWFKKILIVHFYELIHY